MVRPSLTLPRRRRSLRPSGADRQAYADVVSQAFAEERIDAAGLEWRNEKVWSAKTIGALDDLVSDLVDKPEELVPAPSGAVAGRPGASGLPARLIIGGVVLAMLVAGIAGLVAVVSAIAGAIGDATGSSSSGGDGAAALDMFSAEGMQEVVDDLVAAADDRTGFTWLGFYGEYAIAEGPGADGATRIARYDWRDGDVEISPSGETMDDAEGGAFDITTELDLEGIAALATSAPQRTGVADPDSLYVFVSRSYSSADHQIEVSVSLSNEYEDGRITADQNGLIITAEGPGIEPDPMRFLRADGIADALEAVETRLGGSEVTEIGFYGEYVIIEAPPEPGADVVDRFDYRGGVSAYRSGPASIQPDDVARALFSLDDLDPALLAADVEQAAEVLQIRDAESTYMYVERTTGRGSEDRIRISVYVSGPYSSGSVIFDLAGNVIDSY